MCYKKKTWCDEHVPAWQHCEPLMDTPAGTSATGESPRICVIGSLSFMVCGASVKSKLDGKLYREVCEKNNNNKSGNFNLPVIQSRGHETPHNADQRRGMSQYPGQTHSDIPVLKRSGHTRPQTV